MKDQISYNWTYLCKTGKMMSAETDVVISSIQENVYYYSDAERILWISKDDSSSWSNTEWKCTEWHWSCGMGSSTTGPVQEFTTSSEIEMIAGLKNEYSLDVKFESSL